MKWILSLITVAALIWGANWFIGAQNAENEAEAWLTERRDDGWAAQVSGVETKGFPNRYDITFTDIELVDPDTGWAWRAPMFQLLRLSYDADKVIAVWPPEQILASPYELITVTSTDMRASVAFSDVEALNVDTTTWTAEGLDLSPRNGAGVTIDKSVAALRRQEGTEATYDLALTLSGITPSALAKRQLDPAGVLPTRIDDAVIDAVATFDKPWDKSALEEARPQPTAITLKDARASWGALALRFAGDVTIDAAGRPTGKISMQAQNWREMLSLAENSGALDPNVRGVLEGTLQIIAGLSGNSETLDVPVSLKAGRASVGFIPLGDAPPLRLR